MFINMNMNSYSYRARPNATLKFLAPRPGPFPALCPTGLLADARRPTLNWATASIRIRTTADRVGPERGLVLERCAQCVYRSIPRAATPA
jgi:hypothetical protein